MRSLTYAALIITFVYATAVPACARNITVRPSEHVKLTLELKIDKSAFEQGEPIYYELKVTNNSTGEMPLGAPLGDENAADYFFGIESDMKDTVIDSHRSYIQPPLPAMKLAPGASLVFHGFLGALAEKKKASVEGKSSFGPGQSSETNYRITAYWHRPIARHQLDGPYAASNSVSLTIVPSTPESRDARLALFRKQLKAAHTKDNKLIVLHKLAFTLYPQAASDVVKAQRDPELLPCVHSLLYHCNMNRLVVREAITDDLRTHKVTDTLIWRWLDGGDIYEQAEALKFISIQDARQRNKEFLLYILEAVRSGGGNVIDHAVNCLSEEAYPEALDDLLDIARSSLASDSREYNLLQALARYKSDKIVPVLKQIILSAVPDKMFKLRYIAAPGRAANMLAAINIPEAWNALEECAALGNQDVRDLCRTVLEKRK